MFLVNCLFFRNFAGIRLANMCITNMSIRCNIARLIALLWGVWMAGAVYAAPYRTRAMQPGIRTLRVQYVESQSLRRPFLVLGDDADAIDGSDPGNTLEVSFDEMSHDVRQYSYTVRHLNKDWTPSDLSSYEYLRGFTTADITDYELSVNTQQAYTHYSLTFPNSDMQLLASGNYALSIYEDGDMEKEVACVCFSVVEPIAGIRAQVRSNTDIEFDGRYQQLDVDVETARLEVKDPSLVTVAVRQNGRLDNQVMLNTPTFVEPNRLRYINQKSLIFEGGNEFRHFDAYSTYYAGYHVDRIRYAQGEYHAVLDVDEVRGTMAKESGREGLGYLTEYDTNGQWRINAEKTDEPDVDAEYMWVHFCLPVRYPVTGGNVYVGGGLFYDQFGMDNLMQYDADAQCYYLYAYLKQGAYDYMYYVSSDSGTPATLLPVEGSHWQTKNEYTIYVYYRPFGGRYDRLVGLQVTD